MKKLDKLIIQAFLGPFLLTFAVVEFILLTQYMLKYMDEFVGKDLGIAIFQLKHGTGGAATGRFAVLAHDLRYVRRTPRAYGH